MENRVFRDPLATEHVDVIGVMSATGFVNKDMFCATILLGGLYSDALRKFVPSTKQIDRYIFRVELCPSRIAEGRHLELGVPNGSHQLLERCVILQRLLSRALV